MKFSELSSDEHRARAKNWRERYWDVMITMSLLAFCAGGLSVLLLGDIELAILICAVVVVPGVIFTFTAKIMIYLHLHEALSGNGQPSPAD